MAVVAQPVAAPKAGVRSKDLKGKQFKWADLKLVHEFDDASPYKGHAVAYIDHPDDLAALGKTMGHCAGTHFIWACEEKIWYFFTVVTLADMQPHVTLHAKQLKWLGKSHPRDTAPSPYVNNGQTCTKCRGYKGLRGDGRHYYIGYAGVKKCDHCNGTGYEPAKTEGKEKPVPRPRASAGGYPTFKDVVAAFESVGRKYEAGKWGPHQFNSRTYEIPRNYKEPIANFDSLYAYNVINQRPDGVDDTTWDQYRKALASMKAQYDKRAGAVQIVGRAFKFDGKELYSLSFSGRGDSYLNNNTEYRGMMHEFFIECNKKKKESNGS